MTINIKQIKPETESYLPYNLQRSAHFAGRGGRFISPKTVPRHLFNFFINSFLCKVSHFLNIGAHLIFIERLLSTLMVVNYAMECVIIIGVVNKAGIAVQVWINSRDGSGRAEALALCD